MAGGSATTAEDAETTETVRVRVLIPLPLAGPYDYRAEAALGLAPGDVVAAPLGRRVVYGVVWDGAADDGVAEGKLRDLLGRFDVPPVPEVSRRFVDWVAAYTVSAPGAVLRMVLSVSGALEPARPQLAYGRGGHSLAEAGLKETAARRRVLAVVADGPALTATDLAREAGVGVAVVKALAAAGALSATTLPPPRRFAAPRLDGPAPSLSEDQRRAADALVAALGGGFSVHLLDGVTGSGKTEVYLAAVAAMLERGRQVLVLLPEIALSADVLDRFARRFGARPAAWHSDLTAAERRVAWRAVAEGDARIVVGARSALFLPYPELGLIVVDEEHEAAFKQEDGIAYHARDMAVVRARLGDIPAILSSATPSLESLVNAERGRYAWHRLPDRHAGASLPTVAAIDLRRHAPHRGRWLSGPLVAALSETMGKGEQALLFLNRRGYAPLTLCRACGHRLQCPNCTTWLVEHRLAGRLVCHHCGFGQRQPRECPACGTEDALAACGPGVERLAEEVGETFPAARVAVASSDTILGPAAAAEFVRRVQEGEVDLVIGTQIVAKGHHFPSLTLVGVVDADLGLAGGDLRAAERTFQVLHQVAGRAGREERPGRVLLQTHQPDHPVMRALVAGDRDGFLAAEADERRRAGLPPFGRLAALIVSGPDAAAVDAVCRALARAAPRQQGVTVLGPAPAPLAVLRGRHRRRFLLKAPREARVQPLLAAWLAAVKVPASVRVAVDVDPYSFL